MRSFEYARKMEDGKPVIKDGQEVLAYPEAQLPEYQTSKSAGADFFCAEEIVVPSIWEQFIRSIYCLVHSGKIVSKGCETDESKKKYDIKPTFVQTGIKACMEDDEVLELYNRSSNPKKLGLVLANSVGVVDADYYNNPDNDGTIMFAYYNFKPWSVKLKVGDRIGQGVFKKFLRPTEGLCVKDVERTGGYGSTNK